MIGKVSVIIPARNERFLQATITDLLSKGGDVEVIAVLDGYWPDPPLQDDPRLVVLHRGKPYGMRAAINSAAGVARGEWLMKCDAHCMFAEGYDAALAADCERDWIVIPRRYSLDAENWTRMNKPAVDYHYLSCPWTNRDGFSMHGQRWDERRRERSGIDIDDEMSFQGSCWFMHRDNWRRIGGMDEVAYGTFAQEPQEIGNKTWLSGGRVVVNKKTWYAHLHKGKIYGRGYYLSQKEVTKSLRESARLWVRDAWEGQTRKLEWLVEKFWPVPTWPENWKELPIPDEYQRGIAFKI